MATKAATKEDPKKPAMPFVRKMETRTLGIADRVRDYRNKTAKFGSDELAKQLQEADIALRAAAKTMSAMPDDIGYVKPGAAASKGQLDVGATVEIRPTRRKHYDGILADEDMVGLVITKVSQSKVVAQTTAGTRLVLSRGHVALGAPKEEPAESAAKA